MSCRISLGQINRGFVKEIGWFCTRFFHGPPDRTCGIHQISFPNAWLFTELCGI